MNFKVALASLALLTVASSPVIAADANKSAGSGPNPYSDCGIGAALFPAHRVGAVISNVIWDVGTTAVTSATASPETCSGENVQAATYILKSYDTLVEDTARGAGKHLDGLMDILGVAEESRAQTIQNLRKAMAGVVISEAYGTATQVQKAEMFFAVVQS